MGAVIPATTFQAYGVAKAAQDKMTMNLALEFARKGVRVNTVLPGGDFFSSFPSWDHHEVYCIPPQQEQSIAACNWLGLLG